MEQTYWRKCGSCKKDIGFNVIYQVCTVSGCHKFAYCSVDCWGIHNSVMNHKSAWAEENRSPSKENSTPEVRRIIVNSTTSNENKTSSSMDHEILIVASKLKQYIKDKYEMNTSADVMDALSNQVRRVTDQAAEKAKRDGRKTIMARDF
jgi:histone H3/H4